jgi:hypothetical protein
MPTVVVGAVVTEVVCVDVVPEELDCVVVWNAVVCAVVEPVPEEFSETVVVLPLPDMEVIGAAVVPALLVMLLVVPLPGKRMYAMKIIMTTVSSITRYRIDLFSMALPLQFTNIRIINVDVRPACT